MKAVLTLLIVAMVVKDTPLLGDRYVLRTVVQGICLIAGALWLLPNLGTGVLRRLAPLLAYGAMVVALSVPYSSWQLLLQAGSLFAVLLFLGAYAESQGAAGIRHFGAVTMATYVVVCAFSLLLAVVYPTLVYQYQDPLFGRGLRFNGLFAEPAMMSVSAGLLAILAIFSLRSAWLKWPVLAIALCCMALTSTRTFLLAGIAAVALTLWRYYPARRSWYLAAALVIGIAGALPFAFQLDVDTSGIDRTLRTDTVGSLTGRLPLWHAGFEAWRRSPFAGYGFTMGSTGISALGSDLSDYMESDRANRLRSIDTSYSLHNGYLQALLDTGLLGFFFYSLAIGTALFRILRIPPDPAHASLHALLIYFVVANFAESVIFTSANFYSIASWYVIAATLALPRYPSPAGASAAESTHPVAATPLPTYRIG